LGSNNPEKERERNYLGIGAALAIGGVMALLVMVLMLISVGFGGAIVGTIMAYECPTAGSVCDAARTGHWAQS